MDGKLMDLALNAPRKRPQTLERYGLALALAGLALVIRGALPVPEGTAIYQLPLAAVVLSGWFGGRGPGLVALLACVAGILYWFIPPADSFHLPPEYTLGFVIFIGLGALLVEFSGARRRTEFALQASDERFRALVQFSFDVYFETDAVHRLTRQEFSERLTDAPGRASEIGKTRWEIPYVEPDEEGWRQHRATLDAHLPFRDFELARVNADGRTRYLSVSGIPVFDQSGRFAGYRGIGRDITERKRAEAEHRAHLWFLESMDRVSRAMQATNDVERLMSDVLDAVLEVFVCDRAWLLYPCDPNAPSWRVVMEHTRPELPGATARGRDLPMTADSADVARAALECDRALPAGPGHERQVKADLAEHFGVRSEMLMALRPSGDRPYLFGLHQCSGARSWTKEEQRLFEEIGHRLTDALGTLIAFRSLRESEARLERAQRVARVGWWERDYETGGVSMSDEACRIFGVQQVEVPLPHDRWLRLLHPDDRQRAAEASEIALRGGPRYDIEYHVLRADGTLRTVHSQGDVSRDRTGRPVRQFGVAQDITELRQAEQELSESKERFRVLAESSLTGIYLTYMERFSYVNPAFAKMFGYTADEIVNGLGTRDLACPTDRPLVGENMRRRLDGEVDELRYEFRGLRKDGSEFPVEVYGRRITYGGKIGVLGTLIDNTERKHAEHELRESEQRYRTLFEKAYDPIFLENDRDEILEVNERACTLLGYSRDELLKMTVPDLQAPEVRGLSGQVVRDEIARHGNATFQAVDLHRSGRRIPVEVTNSGISDRGENLVLSVVRDITERKRAEENLRASEARFRTFVDHATDAFFLHDERLTVVDVNRQACLSLGYSRDELIGMPPSAFDVGLDETSIIRLGERVAAGETVTFETLHRRKDGVAFPVEIRVRRFQQGDDLFRLSLARDISERKLAEKALRAKDDALQVARTELARVSRLTTLGELTASIAHEVSQPLAAMAVSAGACARWLAAEPPAMAEARAVLDNIVADAKRAREVIARIRALTKREAPRKDRLDVNQNVLQVLALTAQELRSRDVVVRTRLEAELPPVVGDQVQLQQVLLNLIVNAIDAMSDIHDRPRRLTIVSRRDGDKAVVVEVRDAGTGLDPGRAEHVFEAFYTTKTEGLGIGLSISRSIVEAHGGRLWASANKPHGAVFQFWLPVTEEG